MGLLILPPFFRTRRLRERREAYRENLRFGNGASEPSWYRHDDLQKWAVPKHPNLQPCIEDRRLSPEVTQEQHTRTGILSL